MRGAVQLIIGTFAKEILRRRWFWNGRKGGNRQCQFSIIVFLPAPAGIDIRDLFRSAFFTFRDTRSKSSPSLPSVHRRRRVPFVHQPPGPVRWSTNFRSLRLPNIPFGNSRSILLAVKILPIMSSSQDIVGASKVFPSPNFKSHSMMAAAVAEGTSPSTV